MSVVRAHGVGVDGVQFPAPRHERTFIRLYSNLSYPKQKPAI